MKGKIIILLNSSWLAVRKISEKGAEEAKNLTKTIKQHAWSVASRQTSQ